MLLRLEEGQRLVRKNREERRISDELVREAQARHKTLVETTMKALRNAVFPDEVAHFQYVLLKLNLTQRSRRSCEKWCGKKSSEVYQKRGYLSSGISCQFWL